MVMSTKKERVAFPATQPPLHFAPRTRQSLNRRQAIGASSIVTATNSGDSVRGF